MTNIILIGACCFALGFAIGFFAGGLTIIIGNRTRSSVNEERWNDQFPS